MAEFETNIRLLRSARYRRPTPHAPRLEPHPTHKFWGWHCRDDEIEWHNVSSPQVSRYSTDVNHTR